MRLRKRMSDKDNPEKGNSGSFLFLSSHHMLSQASSLCHSWRKRKHLINNLNIFMETEVSYNVDNTSDE